MIRVLSLLLLCSPALALEPDPQLEPDPHFLDNGVIRLGVDKHSGAAVFIIGPLSDPCGDEFVTIEMKPGASSCHRSTAFCHSIVTIDS